MTFETFDQHLQLQYWKLRTWINDNICYLTINCDTGQHSQFLRCLKVLSHYEGLRRIPWEQEINCKDAKKKYFIGEIKGLAQKRSWSDGFRAPPPQLQWGQIRASRSDIDLWWMQLGAAAKESAMHSDRKSDLGHKKCTAHGFGCKRQSHQQPARCQRHHKSKQGIVQS